MRDFSEVIDPTSLKAFYHAAHVQNFTEAAQSAHLTQSGVSQHIAKLEEKLKTQLFVRVGKKVQLTEAGKKLLIYSEKYLDEIDMLIEGISSTDSQLQGTVYYAMPASCLFTPHFPMLLEERYKKYKDLKIDVQLLSSDETIEELLDGCIDFGFVTKDPQNPAIEAKHFATEEYVLVGTLERCFNKLNSDQLKEAKFVDYPGFDTLFEYWRAAHFPRLKKMGPANLRTVGKVNDIHAAITMVRHHMGVSIFPRHCVEDLIKSGELLEYRGSPIAPPTNKIYIITQKDRHISRRVKLVLDCFWRMKGA